MTVANPSPNPGNAPSQPTAPPLQPAQPPAQPTPAQPSPSPSPSSPPKSAGNPGQTGLPGRTGQPGQQPDKTEDQPHVPQPGEPLPDSTTKQPDEPVRAPQEQPEKEGTQPAEKHPERGASSSEDEKPILTEDEGEKLISPIAAALCALDLFEGDVRHGRTSFARLQGILAIQVSERIIGLLTGKDPLPLAIKKSVRDFLRGVDLPANAQAALAQLKPGNNWQIRQAVTAKTGEPPAAEVVLSVKIPTLIEIARP